MMYLVACALFVEMFANDATGLPDDIMERRCPRMGRFQHQHAQDVRVSTRKRLKPYALKVSCSA